MSFWNRKSTPPPEPQLRPVDTAFVAELESLGFFRFVPGDQIAAVKEEALRRGFPAHVEVGRLFDCDAEDLAEGGIRNFVGYVVPFLRREGVHIEVDYKPLRRPALPPGSEPERNPYPGDTLRMQLSLSRGGPLVEFEGDYASEDYRIVIGRQETVFRNDWAEAATQTAALLSRLLSAHGSLERAWLIYGGGNDGYVIFATEEQAALLNSAAPEREQLTTRGS